MIGDLDRRAALARCVPVADGAGGSGDVWQRYAAVWVRLTWSAKAETRTGEVAVARAVYRIDLRRRGDFAVGHRISVDGRIFDVRAVVDGGANVPIVTAICEERV